VSIRPPKPLFVLHLEAQHRHDDANGMRRLRAILKLLLRTFGFKCHWIDYPTDEVDKHNAISRKELQRKD